MKIKGEEIDVHVCNWFEKFSGLMFCRRENAKALLFEFKKPTKMRIHSMFVFFPFVAIWLDEKNKIVDLKIVKPWSLVVSSGKSFSKLVEIPINEKYRRIFHLFRREHKSLKRRLN